MTCIWAIAAVLTSVNFFLSAIFVVSEIESGRVEAVIVKDLSRLGREYLQTGYYTEIFFPQKDVRFIAVNDNVDTVSGENDFAPFKNIINEWYAKDISRKIRSSIKTKALNGEYMGSFAPYGYAKSSEQYTEITELNEVLLNNLIQKIVIHGTPVNNKNSIISVEIYYRFIGKVKVLSIK